MNITNAELEPATNESKALRRIVVLISGSGTNLQALIDAQNTPSLPNAQIVLVVSNRKNAHGLVRAASASPPIPTAYLALQPFLKANPGKTREDYDVEVAKLVRDANPDVVVLAGWMHILSERFLDGMTRMEGGEVDKDGKSVVLEQETRLRTTSSNALCQIPVINLHPALPGAFDGAHAIERGYEAFQKGEVDELGVMVHRVIRDVDRGEPLIVQKVPLEKAESLEVFEERLHKTEWQVIVEGTRKVLEEV